MAPQNVVFLSFSGLKLSIFDEYTYIYIIYICVGVFSILDIWQSALQTVLLQMIKFNI